MTSTDDSTCPPPSSPPLSTSPPFYIRSFIPADLPAVQSLFLAGQVEYGAGLEGYCEHIFKSDLSDPLQHYVHAPHSAFLCAALRGSEQVVGAVGLRPLRVADPEYYAECSTTPPPYPHCPPPPLLQPDSTLELNRMVVSPELRRAGVARALMAQCVQRCRELGYSGIHLTTLATMRQAVALYSAVGFTRYRTDRINYSSDARFWTPQMQRLYDEAGGLSEKDRTRACISDNEVPAAEEAVRAERQRGIHYVTHFYLHLPAAT